jgi:hypothetical protein
MKMLRKTLNKIPVSLIASERPLIHQQAGMILLVTFEERKEQLLPTAIVLFEKLVLEHLDVFWNV